MNVLYRHMPPALREPFFYLTYDDTWRVAGDWLVDFAGRRLILPLRRDFPLAWAVAVGFQGYDRELDQLYAALVASARPPRVFFDVGANYGLHSLRLLAHGVRVISFEPNGACHGFFVECCHANGLRPEIVPAAVADDVGWVTLAVPARRTYLGSIVPRAREQWGDDVTTFEVPVTSLDVFVAAHGVVPDLLKLDIEGAELAALRGARALLRRARPVVIFESWRSSAERHEIYRLLADAGYSVVTAKTPHREARLSAEAFAASPATNFVALPPADDAPFAGDRAAGRVSDPRATLAGLSRSE